MPLRGDVVNESHMCFRPEDTDGTNHTLRVSRNPMVYHVDKTLHFKLIQADSHLDTKFRVNCRPREYFASSKCVAFKREEETVHRDLDYRHVSQVCPRIILAMI